MVHSAWRRYTRLASLTACALLFCAVRCACVPACLRQSGEEVIDVMDTHPGTFEHLLDYIYGKSVNIPSTELVEVLGLASRYQVAGLVEQVCIALKRDLNARTCSTVLSAADFYGCAELRSEVWVCGRTHVHARSLPPTQLVMSGPSWNIVGVVGHGDTQAMHTLMTNFAIASKAPDFPMLSLELMKEVLAR